ncbi:MAG: cysteine--tRNA ligase [Cytophagales bacterium]|nr:cysteine--tRNA ligase [Cytophagales bacterium]
MQSKLLVYNTLSHTKEVFVPLHTPHVGMYVCGPTVYGPPHLGHARGAIAFDIIYRYLTYSGYKVRYVRNITDVGHLENDSDHGEDKIAKKARIENLEPMEIAQLYTNLYHRDMDALHVKRPSIEPLATGHIGEQIEMVKHLLSKGWAYESKGSVYFDVNKYAKHHSYGEVSGRVLDDLLSGTRTLDGQDEKKDAADFALWKKASIEHIMQWHSPWGKGFPGWHIECTAMSTKYLGHTFDIHGGGMDLLFPHHESEMAQSKGCHGHSPAKYWLHNNMVTINGQKMAKSLGNFITLEQLFTGKNELLQQSFSPMAVRFFILQAHYRSTIDFSNDALKAASKAYYKLLNTYMTCNKLVHNPSNDLNIALDSEIAKQCTECMMSMDDDFNTGAAIGYLFQLSKHINAFYNKQADINTISNTTFEVLIKVFNDMFTEILGFAPDTSAHGWAKALLPIYQKAKDEKRYDTVDALRQVYKQQGLLIKDMKTGTDWQYEE